MGPRPPIYPMKLKRWDTQDPAHFYLSFWCPACRDQHSYVIGGGRGWTWDGDLESPTFSPSLLVHPRRRFKPGTTDAEIEAARLVTPEGEPLAGITETTFRCHLFLRSGKIQYCGDCDHALAGQTIDLPEFPEEER